MEDFITGEGKLKYRLMQEKETEGVLALHIRPGKSGRFCHEHAVTGISLEQVYDASKPPQNDLPF